MIAYVDASVLLRFALGQPDVLLEWRQIEKGVSSALVRTESLRTLDRLRLPEQAFRTRRSRRGERPSWRSSPRSRWWTSERLSSIEPRSQCPPNLVPSMPFTSQRLFFGNR